TPTRAPPLLRVSKAPWPHPAAHSSATGRASAPAARIPTKRCEEITRASTRSGTERCVEGGESLPEERDLVWRPGGDAQRIRRAERPHRPHDHAAAEWGLVPGVRVADANEEEVRYGRAGGLQAVPVQYIVHERHRFPVHGASPRDLGPVVEARKRRLP